MQKIRTIKNAWADLHRMDPNCGISQSFIRQLVSDGRCPSITVGNRSLIDLDVLLRVLEKEMCAGDE